MADLNTPYNIPFAMPTTDQRAGEVSAADWAGGMNRGGNSCGIGITTGEPIAPSNDTWVDNILANITSQKIGGTARSLVAYLPPDTNDTATFLQASGSVAPGAAILASVINRSRFTLSAGQWIWGTQTVA